MRGRTAQPSVNQPAHAKRNQTQGYHRYMPLKEFTGKNAKRELQGNCVWHDFGSNKSFDAGQNWEKAPPGLPSGDPGAEPRCQPPSEAYREHYELIDWSM